MVVILFCTRSNIVAVRVSLSHGYIDLVPSPLGNYQYPPFLFLFFVGVRGELENEATIYMLEWQGNYNTESAFMHTATLLY